MNNTELLEKIKDFEYSFEGGPKSNFRLISPRIHFHMEHGSDMDAFRDIYHGRRVKEEKLHTINKNQNLWLERFEPFWKKFHKKVKLIFIPVAIFIWLFFLAICSLTLYFVCGDEMSLKLTNWLVLNGYEDITFLIRWLRITILLFIAITARIYLPFVLISILVEKVRFYIINKTTLSFENQP